MQENANNNEDGWEEWDMNEAESKKEDQATTDLEGKLSCETEAASNKYESANQQKANLDLETEEVHLATAADEPIEKSEIEQKDDGDLEEQQDNDQAIDVQLEQHNGLESILNEHLKVASINRFINNLYTPKCASNQDVLMHSLLVCG